MANVLTHSTPDHARPPLPEALGAHDRGPVDFDAGGAVPVRVWGGGPRDLVTVAREIGPPREPSGTEPALEIRFVDAFDDAPVRSLGGTMGHTDDGLYFLDPVGRRTVRVSTEEGTGRPLLTCVRGAETFPFLAEAVDLEAIHRGWVPFHASAWTADGMGFLATGWPHSGKTGLLIRACEAGGTIVGDDRLFVDEAGSRMVGPGRSIHLRDWHVAQLDLPGTVGPLRRALARAYPTLEAVEARLGGKAGRIGWRALARKALGRARRGLGLRIDPARSPEWRGAAGGARPDVLLLLETHESPSVSIHRIDGPSALRRMSALLEAELMPALRAEIALAAAVPGEWPWDVRAATERAHRLLALALASKPVYGLRYPYPCSLDRVHAEVRRLDRQFIEGS